MEEAPNQAPRPDPATMRTHFLWDEGTRKTLAELRLYAEAHPIRLAEMVEMIIGIRPPICYRPEHCRRLPIGHAVIFSIERQAKGPCRHLSVSVSTPGRLPAIPVVQLIATELGFRAAAITADSLAGQLKVWLEQIAPGHEAVNLAEYIEPRPIQ